MMLLIALIISTACLSSPKKIEIPKPVQPEFPNIRAVRVDGGVKLSEQDFVKLVHYMEKMKGYAAELNVVIDYYKE